MVQEGILLQSGGKMSIKVFWHEKIIEVGSLQFTELPQDFPEGATLTFEPPEGKRIGLFFRGRARYVFDTDCLLFWSAKEEEAMESFEREIGLLQRLKSWVLERLEQTKITIRR